MLSSRVQMSKSGDSQMRNTINAMTANMTRTAMTIDHTPKAFARELAMWASNMFPAL